MRILRRVLNERIIAIPPAHDEPVEPPSGLKLFLPRKWLVHILRWAQNERRRCCFKRLPFLEVALGLMYNIGSRRVSHVNRGVLICSATISAI